MNNLTFDVPMHISGIERLLTVNFDFSFDYGGHDIDEITLKSVETVLLDNKTIVDYMETKYLLTREQWDTLGRLAYKHTNNTVMIL